METEECFNKYPIKLADGSDYFVLKPDVQGDVPIELTLPKGLSCKHCVFRWHWKAENNWGDCDDGTEAVGCGPQEHWRNCSDITIEDEGRTLTKEASPEAVPEVKKEKLTKEENPENSTKDPLESSTVYMILKNNKLHK